VSDSRRVLVIEDEENLRSLLQDILEDKGFVVDLAADGQAGVEMAMRQVPDVVITDLLTPRMHGYEVIRALRKAPQTKRTPIIVVSGQAYPTDQQKALDLGAQKFLVKPFRPAELIAAIEEVWGSLKVRFWGVRGSIAAPGPETIRYGGNTPCVTLERGRDVLILDAGTGVRKLGLALQAEAGSKPLTVNMLITHTHWDHIQGFPFFVPAYVPGNKVNVWGPPSMDKPLGKVLRGQMDPAYFPVGLGDMAAELTIKEIREPEFQVGPFKVKAMYVNHPGITMGYRIEIDGLVVTYATDTEPYRTLLGWDADQTRHGEKVSYGGKRDAELVAFAYKADLYIADSQYTPEEYKTKRGWGHTCYTDCVQVALEAKAKRIALFSHDPMHDDDMIDEKVAACRALAAGTGLEVLPAIEGAVIDLSPVKQNS
jgi:CheY-like chemotaxis protein/phosphoribosyl 1,2-cyclic phosphodiesterase